MSWLRLILLLLLLSGKCFCQDTTLVVKGKIIDAETQQPISYANIRIENSIKGALADTSGKFKIVVQKKHTLLKITAVGYDYQIISVDTLKQTEIRISLKRSVGFLNEVVINSSATEIVSKSKNSNVLDYDFYDDHILMITFRNSLAQSKLVLLSSLFDTLSVIKIPEEPVRLFKDCFGNNHIVCENKTYQVYYNGMLQLLSPQTIKDFETILMPCVAADSLNVFLVQKHGSELLDVGFHSFYSNNLALNYSFIHKQTKLKKELVVIQDEYLMKMRKDEPEFERIKQRAGLSTEGDRLFAETILFKEIYAPLYIIDRQTYVFDFVNSKINTYSITGEKTNSVAITFHKDKTWKRMMCIDVKTNKAYSVFEKNGITELRCIDLKMGSIQSTHKIPFVFVNTLKVKDNYIYYLYKDKGYDGTTYLSRMRTF